MWHYFNESQILIFAESGLASVQDDLAGRPVREAGRPAHGLPHVTHSQGEDTGDGYRLSGFYGFGGQLN